MKYVYLVVELNVENFSGSKTKGRDQDQKELKLQRSFLIVMFQILVELIIHYT
jgi:hypothetical protein